MSTLNSAFNPGGATRPLPRDRARGNSTETHQSGQAPNSGPKIKKMEEVVSKMAQGRGSGVRQS